MASLTLLFSRYPELYVGFSSQVIYHSGVRSMRSTYAYVESSIFGFWLIFMYLYLFCYILFSFREMMKRKENDERQRVAVPWNVFAKGLELSPIRTGFVRKSISVFALYKWLHLYSVCIYPNDKKSEDPFHLHFL
ncbi:hypothetical protein BDV41DRAFT_536403, partial [Aspergillus transmontanensis]